MSRLLVFIAVATLLFEPVAAWAHAKLVKSEPAQRAVLSQPPSQLRLWFNEAIEPAFCVATVIDASGNTVTSTQAAVSNTDPKLLVLPLPRLAKGVYTVQFQVVSVDGHTVKSGFKFEIREAARLK
jgi:methionine-rich copper-binding protein CopC